MLHVLLIMVFVFGELLLNHGAQSYVNGLQKLSKRTIQTSQIGNHKLFDAKLPHGSHIPSIQANTENELKTTNSINVLAKATLFTSSINLLKNCVGGGVFSLNSRVSAITSDPSQFKYVVILIFGMASWAIYNFYIVGEICRLTKSSTYGEAWSKTVSVNSQWLIQFVITAAPIVSCVANTIILTDVLKLLLRVVGIPEWVYTTRPCVVLALCVCVLFPICAVKDLSALKSVSIIGLAGQLSAMIVLAIRLFDGSYSLGGSFYDTTNIGRSSAIITSLPPVSMSKWFILASLLSYCYVTHYNAPRYYTELAGAEEQPLKFLKMTSLSYLTAGCIYLLTIIIAMRLFGPQSQSFALNSFSPHDPLGLIAFLAFGISVLASYPLIFFSMRNWFIKQAHRHLPSIGKVRIMTALLLTLIGGITMVCTDIGKVGSLAGAVFGSSMMFIFPPLMYINALWKQCHDTAGMVKQDSENQVDSANMELSSVKKPYGIILFNSLSFVAGLVIAVIGMINSARNFFTQ